MVTHVECFFVCFAALRVNACDLKGLDAIFGMMAGGRPRMLTEDDIKKREEGLQRRIECCELEFMCCMHTCFTIALSLSAHVHRVIHTLVAVQATKTNAASAQNTRVIMTSWYLPI